MTKIFIWPNVLDTFECNLRYDPFNIAKNIDCRDDLDGNWHRDRTLLCLLLDPFWVLLIRTKTRTDWCRIGFGRTKTVYRWRQVLRVASAGRRRGRRWSNTFHCDVDSRCFIMALLCRADRCGVHPGKCLICGSNLKFMDECGSPSWTIGLTDFYSNIGHLYPKGQHSSGKQFGYVPTSSVLSHM